MPSTRQTLGKWGDGGVYSSTGLVDPTPFWNSPGSRTFTKREALTDRGTMHYVSVRINYTDASGETPIFSNLSVYTEPTKGQPVHTHTSLIDRSTVNSVSIRINHSGGVDLVIENVRVLAQQEKQRPRG